MTTGILGRKVGMTQIFDDAGNVVPVTVIEAGPCSVLQVRTAERDGYEAIQLGFGDKKRPKDGRGRSRRSQARRSERGHVTARLESKRSQRRAQAGVESREKAECEPKQFVREIRGPVGDLGVGSEVKVGVFEPSLDAFPEMLKELAVKLKVSTEDNPGWRNELMRELRKKKRMGDYHALLKKVTSVDVTATSKGRGYAGVMKRHNFAGQRASHGVKKVHRHAGGTGMSAAPSRLFKGRRMAGQYGNATTTTRNLKVVRIDEENNLLLVRGAVPGPNGGLVVVKQTNKKG